MSETRLPRRFSVAHRGPAKGPEYEAWRESICRGFCRLDVSPGDGDQIDCRNDFVLIDRVAMATPKGQHVRFARTCELLQDGCDDLVLISATNGPTRVVQKGKIIDLEAGQMCLTEMNVVGTVELGIHGGFTTTRFPRSFLLQSSPSAERHIAQVLSHDSAASGMIDRYFALCNDMAVGLDATGRTIAARHLADLVGLLLGTMKDHASTDGSRGISAARLDLMKDDICKNLSRADLSISSIARANGLSERQAQRLFARSGTTFSEFVREQRLSSARRLLHGPNTVHKISHVAYCVGFNDLSYFNRSFRKRFGMAPSEAVSEWRGNESVEDQKDAVSVIGAARGTAQG
jgi:AraC-like DNA-binding protein